MAIACPTRPVPSDRGTGAASVRCSSAPTSSAWGGVQTPSVDRDRLAHAGGLPAPPAPDGSAPADTARPPEARQEATVRSSSPHAAPGGLSWAAVRQQRQHCRHHRGRRAQPPECCPCRRAEGAPARPTPVASLLLTRDTAGPLPAQPPGGAVLIGAEDALRVRGGCAPDRGE